MVWENDCYPKKFLILRQAGPCGKSQFLGRMTVVFWDLWSYGRLNLAVISALAAGHSFKKNNCHGLGLVDTNEMIFLSKLV